MIVSTGFFTALECTKLVFGRGSALVPAGELTALPPNPLAGLRGTLLLRGRKGRGGNGGEGGDVRGGNRRVEEGPAPLTQIPRLLIRNTVDHLSIYHSCQ